MSLFTVILFLVVVGLVLWLLSAHLAIEGTTKKVLSVIVIAGVILLLLSGFGIVGPQANMHIGNFHMKW